MLFLPFLLEGYKNKIVITIATSSRVKLPGSLIARYGSQEQTGSFASRWSEDPRLATWRDLNHVPVMIRYRYISYLLLWTRTQSYSYKTKRKSSRVNILFLNNNHQTQCLHKQLNWIQIWQFLRKMLSRQNSVTVFNSECKFNPCPIDHVYACNFGFFLNQILKKSKLKPKIVQF